MYIRSLERRNTFEGNVFEVYDNCGLFTYGRIVVLRVNLYYAELDVSSSFEDLFCL